VRFLLAVFALWFLICLVPDGRTSAANQNHLSEERQTLYAPHTCDSGRWFFETSDADSVTVSCYTPDAPQDPDPE
jgi:hypothetical protein